MPFNHIYRSVVSWPVLGFCLCGLVGSSDVRTGDVVRMYVRVSFD